MKLETLKNTPPWDRPEGSNPDIQEASQMLGDLIDSDDEEIAEAVHEALAMAEGVSSEDDEDDDVQR
jgi:hypothetical protein